MSPVHCYPSPGKRKGGKLCLAFAKGCGGAVLPVGHPRLEPGSAFFYGWTAHSAPLIARCRTEGRTWFYADNAYYFGRHRYFRVTRNAFMHDGSGEAGPARFQGFGIRVRPWRRGGRHILITTQSELHFALRCGTTLEQWTEAVTTEIRKHSDRPIRVAHKPPVERGLGNPAAHPAFEALLEDAWAVVAHSSSTLVKALIEGVPVFSLAPSMASRMGLSDLSRIETPFYPEGREPWLWNLAANQWTREEMADGTCWRMLRDHSLNGAA